MLDKVERIINLISALRAHNPSVELLSRRNHARFCCRFNLSSFLACFSRSRFARSKR
jgi:hypothetical protein